jgi:glutamate 5-kinase
VDKLKGLRTERMAEVLGGVPYEEVVHRDNLAVIA